MNVRVPQIQLLIGPVRDAEAGSPDMQKSVEVSQVQYIDKNVMCQLCCKAKYPPSKPYRKTVGVATGLSSLIEGWTSLSH